MLQIVLFCQPCVLTIPMHIHANHAYLPTLCSHSHYVGHAQGQYVTCILVLYGTQLHVKPLILGNSIPL